MVRVESQKVFEIEASFKRRNFKDLKILQNSSLFIIFLPFGYKIVLKIIFLFSNLKNQVVNEGSFQGT